jgi:hypothetical protein
MRLRMRLRMRSKSILKVHGIIDIPYCASHLLEVGPSVPIDEESGLRKKSQNPSKIILTKRRCVAPEEEVAAAPEDVEEADIVQADAQDSVEESMPIGEGERTQKEESEATANEFVEAEVAPEDEAGTPEDVEEEDIVQADAQNSTEEKVPLDKGEPTQEEDSGKLDEM